MKLTILGSTGSIGTQALDVCKMHGIEVTALAAFNNVKLLEEQARRFKPKMVCLASEAAAEDLKVRLTGTGIKVLGGEEAVLECAAFPESDMVLNGIVGIAGLRPTLAAIEAGKNIALANKETLVAAGEIVTKAAVKNEVSIIPVDSEHSAIFQCLQGSPGRESLKKIILTASGGPFFGKDKAYLENVTPAEALKHPNWSMGKKVTIDSATMMNKGLEFIEARWLFGTENIEILVHRESIIHSAVMFKDNAVIAQLGVPDMRIPIQYALTYPNRLESPAEELDLAQYGKLTFYRPDDETFPGISICKEAIRRGGVCPAAVNGANEAAVHLFLEGKIKLTDIANINEEAMLTAPKTENITLADVLSADRAAREAASAKY